MDKSKREYSTADSDRPEFKRTRDFTIGPGEYNPKPTVDQLRREETRKRFDHLLFILDYVEKDFAPAPRLLPAINRALVVLQRMKSVVSPPETHANTRRNDNQRDEKVVAPTLTQGSAATREDRKFNGEKVTPPTQSLTNKINDKLILLAAEPTPDDKSIPPPLSLTPAPPLKNTVVNEDLPPSSPSKTAAVAHEKSRLIARDGLSRPLGPESAGETEDWQREPGESDEENRRRRMVTGCVAEPRRPPAEVGREANQLHSWEIAPSQVRNPRGHWPQGDGPYRPNYKNAAARSERGRGRRPARPSQHSYGYTKNGRRGRDSAGRRTGERNARRRRNERPLSPYLSFIGRPVSRSPPRGRDGEEGRAIAPWRMHRAGPPHCCDCDGHGRESLYDSGHSSRASVGEPNGELRSSIDEREERKNCANEGPQGNADPVPQRGQESPTFSTRSTERGTEPGEESSIHGSPRRPIGGIALARSPLPEYRTELGLVSYATGHCRGFPDHSGNCLEEDL